MRKYKFEVNRDQFFVDISAYRDDHGYASLLFLSEAISNIPPFID